MKNKMRVICIVMLIVFTLQSIVIYAEESTQIQTEEQLNQYKEIDKELISQKEQLLKEQKNQSQRNVIIKYKPNSKKNFKNNLLKEEKQGNRNTKKLLGENIESMELSEYEIECLKLDSEVELIEEDASFQISAKPSKDAMKDEIPWNVSAINADLVQDEGYDGRGVKVAIFDTGIDLNNTELNIKGGISFVEGVTSYLDDNGHGTSMAGILAASKNNNGIIGVAHNVNLYSVKVLDQNGSGNYSSVIKGIQWAIDNKMDIIAMSFGGAQYSKILEDAILEATNNNILIVAAAGNDGSSAINYPARYGKVVCVGAVDEMGRRAIFSNTGIEMDITAPGVGIKTTAIGNTFATVSGTSASVPHVVGVAAQILSAKKKLKVDQIKAILYNSTTPILNMSKDGHGWGVVNAYNSIENIDKKLVLDEYTTRDIQFNLHDAGENGTIATSFIIYGNNQTISVGQTAEVRAGFISAHNQLEVTVENSSGVRMYPTVYRAPIAGNGAYVTYVTPVFTSAGQYRVRYHCSDNADATYDDIFNITVTSGTTPPNPTTDDYGSSFSSAYNMSVFAGSTASLNGTLEAYFDDDYFKFTAPSTGLYTIKSTNNTVDVMGFLYNSSQTELANNDDSNGTTNFTIASSLTQGQVYYIKVKHYDSCGIGSYTLNVTAPAGSTVTDDYGNSFGTAYNLPISAGTTVTRNGHLEIANDVDYFKFTAPSAGTYTISSSNITVDVRGWLYNSSQVEMISNDDSNGTTNFLMTAVLTQGQIYYVKVSHYSQNGTGTYTLNITAPGITDDYGNTFGTAYNLPISVGTTYTRNGVLEIANDVDYFKFTAPSAGIYTISSSNITVDVRGWLYNSSQVEMISNDDSNGTTNFLMEAALIQGQIYYIKVSHYSQNGTGIYTLSVASPITRTVTYNGNGNTSGTVPASQTWTSGSTLTLRTNTGLLARTGYTFAGWNTNAAGTGTTYTVGQTGVNLGSANVILYAKWTATATNTVTYNGNGNTSGTVPAIQTWTSGSTLTLRTNTGSLSRTGYTFAGWNTNAAGTGTTYTVGQTGVNLGSANVTLYAKWTVVTNTVTYNGNGNTSGTVPASQTWSSGSTLTLRTNTGSLSRTGYTFAGWNTNAAGTGTTYTVGQTGVNLGSVNVTLYAKWTVVTNTVTYNGNGNTSGTVPASQTWTSGSSLTLRTNTGALAKTGYTFAGWNTNSAGTGTTYAAGATVNLGTANITLYPEWLEANYSYSYGMLYSDGLDTRYDATNSSSDFGLAGYNAYSNIDPSYAYVSGINPNTGTSRMESDILFISAHGTIGRVYFEPTTGNDFHITTNFVQPSTSPYSIQLYDYDFTNTKLITFASCNSGASGYNDLGNYTESLVFTAVFDQGAQAAVGWREPIDAVDHTDWLRRYTNELARGETLIQAINYANGFTYVDPDVTDSIVVLGNENLTITVGGSLARSSEYMGQDALFIEEEAYITVHDEKSYEKVRGVQFKDNANENLVLDSEDIDSEKIIKLLNKYTRSIIDLEDFVVEVVELYEGYTKVELIQTIDGIKTTNSITANIKGNIISSIYNNIDEIVNAKEFNETYLVKNDEINNSVLSGIDLDVFDIISLEGEVVYDVQLDNYVYLAEVILKHKEIGYDAKQMVKIVIN